MLTMVDAGGTPHTVSSLTQIDASGTPRTLQQLWMNDAGNTPRMIFSTGGSGTGSLAPDYVYGAGNSRIAIPVTTSTATVNGAPAGATFAWVFADSGWTATTPNSSSSQFRSFVGPGVEQTTTVYCTVTLGGASYNTNIITATVTNVSEGE